MNLFKRMIPLPIRALKRTTMDAMFAQRSSEPFATHMPILIGVAAIASPSNVLELGSGLFSTPALNNPALFPSVTHVHTMEDDAAWAATVKNLRLDPSRSQFEQTTSIRERVRQIDLNRYDMIFVDSSMQLAERAKTLRLVLEKAAAHTVVVMHDFEYREYRRAVPRGWHQFAFRAWLPMTGVLWRQGVDRGQLDTLQRTLLANRHSVPTDTSFWRERLT